MTTRSDKYIQLFEGFKLGALGVSTKPKVGYRDSLKDDTVDNTKSQGISNVSAFKKIDTFIYDWLEPLTPGIARINPDFVEYLPKTKKSEAYIQVNATLFPDSDKKRPEKERWFPALYIIIQRKDKNVAAAFYRQQHNFGFETKEEVGAWIEKNKSKCEQHGVKALEFTTVWEFYRR
jgi:hypothetical protein